MEGTIFLLPTRDFDGIHFFQLLQNGWAVIILTSSVNTAAYWWIPISHKLISGFGAEYQNLWGDAPFYMLPFINMRGISISRYQGNTIGLGETEWRWDFTSRFSLVGFAGAGKAVLEGNSWSDAFWRASGGVGGI